ncbi:MAG TPA: SDR family oxidoreductase [Candidatus Binatia bacterium]|nr:SDR family oxidoreductase [Candidatus Binatia bacterium]
MDGALRSRARLASVKLGPSSIRVICLWPHAIPEAVATSHAGEVVTLSAGRLGTTADAMLTGMVNTTRLKRLPTFDEVANFAAFEASDHASAMTGAIANLSSGSLLD